MDRYDVKLLDLLHSYKKTKENLEEIEQDIIDYLLLFGFKVKK